MRRQGANRTDQFPQSVRALPLDLHFRRHRRARQGRQRRRRKCLASGSARRHLRPPGRGIDLRVLLRGADFSDGQGMAFWMATTSAMSLARASSSPHLAGCCSIGGSPDIFRRLSPRGQTTLELSPQSLSHETRLVQMPDLPRGACTRIPELRPVSRTPGSDVIV